ncbi:hypothetical protein Emag_003558 [Eimeria magna]
MVQLIFSRQLALSLPSILLYVSLYYGKFAWGSLDTASGDADEPQYGNFPGLLLETRLPQTSIVSEGTDAYKQAASYDRVPRQKQPPSLSERQRVESFKQFAVNPTYNEVYERRVVSKECVFAAGLQKSQAILRQLFAGSCPLHWQPLGSAAFDLSQRQPRMQLRQVASLWEAQSAEDLHQASAVLPGELRLHSHTFRLGIGDITTVFAEVLDTRGQLYPTYCGSVSLQLLQPGKKEFDPAWKPPVSGLGVQLLKGGRARWRLKVDNFAPPLLALQAVPRLCTSSLFDGKLLLDSHPGSALLLPAVLALEIILPEEEGFKVLTEPQQLLSGGTELLVDEGAHGRTPQQGGIAKVELLTEEKGSQGCCSQQTKASQLKLIASSDQEVFLLGAENHRGSITSCTQQPPSMSICKHPALVYEILGPEMTLESPVFVYSFRLSYKPSLPVNVSIFPMLESFSDSKSAETRQLVNYFVDGGDTSVINGQVQLFVGEEAYKPGNNIRLEPEEWNKPVIVAVKLSVALAASAAAEVKAGGAPLMIDVKHILLADSSDERENVTFPTTGMAVNSRARSVSVHCTVHTYIDDVSIAEPHKWADDALGVRPISVRCHIQPNDDVDGEIRINVSGGSSIRLLSPKPGSDLVLTRGESAIEANSNSLESTVGENWKEDPTAKTSSQGTESSNKQTLAWGSAKVDALLFPGELGCTDTACTLTFDLGSRDERRGGDLRLFPLGGKVALLPHSSAKHETPLEDEPEQLTKRFYLSRPWVLMTKNQVQAELRILDRASSLEEVLAGCIKASCSTAEKYPIENNVRCVAKEDVKKPHGTDDTIDLFITLKPAVSSSCTLLHPNGKEIGKLQVLATTSALCDESSFYNRDTATCQQCPRGFSCFRGRLLQCGESESSRGELEDCPLCLDGKA